MAERNLANTRQEHVAALFRHGGDARALLAAGAVAPEPCVSKHPVTEAVPVSLGLRLEVIFRILAWKDS